MSPANEIETINSLDKDGDEHSNDCVDNNRPSQKPNRRSENIYTSFLQYGTILKTLITSFLRGPGHLSLHFRFSCPADNTYLSLADGRKTFTKTFLVNMVLTPRIELSVELITAALTAPRPEGLC